MLFPRQFFLILPCDQYQELLYHKQLDSEWYSCNRMFLQYRLDEFRIIWNRKNGKQSTKIRRVARFCSALTYICLVYNIEITFNNCDINFFFQKYVECQYGEKFKIWCLFWELKFLGWILFGCVIYLPKIVSKFFFVNRFTIYSNSFSHRK